MLWFGVGGSGGGVCGGGVWNCDGHDAATTYIVGGGGGVY